MDALGRERVEVGRKRSDKRLAFTGLHFGDFAAMEGDAADQLHVIVTLAERTLRGLADRCKRFRQQVVELGALGEALTEHLGLVAQLFIRQRADRRLEGVGGIDVLAQRTDIAVVSRSKDGLGQCGDHVKVPVKRRSLLPAIGASARYGEKSRAM